MAFKGKENFLRMSIAGGIVAMALAGCSTMQSLTGDKGGGFPPPDPAGSSKQASAKPAGPPPNVSECGVVSIGSPSKYVCNGKVYTTFQLAKMRKDYNAQQQAGK
jgi:hypothetical protein